MKTQFKIKGNWNEIKGKLQKKFPGLTEEDLKFSNGKENELLGRISKKTGQTKDDICEVIDQFKSEKQSSH